MSRVIPDPADEPVVTIERAAEILGIGRSAAYNAVERGELPALRFGKLLRVPTAWLVRAVSVDIAS